MGCRRRRKLYRYHHILRKLWKFYQCTLDNMDLLNFIDLLWQLDMSITVKLAFMAFGNWFSCLIILKSQLQMILSLSLLVWYSSDVLTNVLDMNRWPYKFFLQMGFSPHYLIMLLFTTTYWCVDMFFFQMMRFCPFVFLFSPFACRTLLML